MPLRVNDDGQYLCDDCFWEYEDCQDDSFDGFRESNDLSMWELEL